MAAPSHYENFPVGSLLLPRRIRPAVHAIYHFARYADDLADEGEVDVQTRLDGLQDCRNKLCAIEAGDPFLHDAIFGPLAAAIQQHSLPFSHFYDLLDAFEQDVTVSRYETFADVVAYCRKSANPVGRLMLHLFGEHDRRALAMSDGICTALQLTNFLQDVAIDWQKGRVYLPQEELRRYRVTETQIANQDCSGLWEMMMRAQVKRARDMLGAGAPLAKQLPGRFGFELRLIVMGGETILRKIHRAGGDVFSQRIRLEKRDWLYMFYRALRAN